jgi:hypothetical protein
MHSDPAAFDQQVRLRVYDDFLKLGEAPSSEHLARVLRVPTDEIRTSLARLAATRALVLQQDGEILMASPLSAVPTPFVVSVADRQWFANCIWDGLGLVAMLGGFGEVETSCGCCGFRLFVDVQNGGLQLSGGNAVAHFALPARQWWDDIVFN